MKTRKNKKDEPIGNYYYMFIQPAMTPKERHQIEDALEKIGYTVTGGGTMLDGSECDISFVKKV